MALYELPARCRATCNPTQHVIAMQSCDWSAGSASASASRVNSTSPAATSHRTASAWRMPSGVKPGPAHKWNCVETPVQLIMLIMLIKQRDRGHRYILCPVTRGSTAKNRCSQTWLELALHAALQIPRCFTMPHEADLRRIGRHPAAPFCCTLQCHTLRFS